MNVISYAIKWFEKTARMHWAWFHHTELELLSSTWDNYIK